MGYVLRRPALALALAIAACGFAAFAPVANASPGDLVASVSTQAFGGTSIAFDGQVLYYTNPGDPTLYRVTPQGVPLPPIPITGLPTLEGISTLSYDVTRDMFWATDDSDGRQVFLIDKLGNAQLQFVIPDTELPGECKDFIAPGVSFCQPLVDGLAFDAQSDTIWWSPDESHRIYHFDTVGGSPATLPDVGVTGPAAILLGYYDIDQPGNSMGEHGCVPFSSGIAVGTHGGPDASGSPTAVMYDFAGRCSNWFQYLGDNDNTPTLQQVYTTYTGTEAEDDECDNVTFKVPVVWVRDHEDNIFRAFETPVCFLGGGVAVAKTNRMTGGGGLPIVYPTSLQGQQAHNGFMLHCYSFDQPDNLEITWGNGNSFHLTNDTSSLCDNDPNATGSSGASFNHIHGFGTGRANGQPGATVKWSFTDNGEPGTNDYGDITVEVPLSQMPACTNIDPSTLTDPTSEMCIVMHAQGNLMPGPLMGEGNYQAHDAG